MAGSSGDGAHWLPARRAVDLLNPSYRTKRLVYDAIINRCGGGMIRSKCLRQSGTRDGKQVGVPLDDSLISPDFWLQFQDPYLRSHEDWLAGDFTLIVVSSHRSEGSLLVRVYGVEFDEDQLRATGGLPRSPETYTDYRKRIGNDRRTAQAPDGPGGPAMAQFRARGHAGVVTFGGQQPSSPAPSKSTPRPRAATSRRAVSPAEFDDWVRSMTPEQRALSHRDLKAAAKTRFRGRRVPVEFINGLTRGRLRGRRPYSPQPE
jgi:hypothetical protein